MEPDVDNLQVLGIEKGRDSKEAFKNLLIENEWLSATSFNKANCFELKNLNYEKFLEVFYLDEA